MQHGPRNACLGSGECQTLHRHSPPCRAARLVSVERRTCATTKAQGGASLSPGCVRVPGQLRRVAFHAQTQKSGPAGRETAHPNKQFSAVPGLKTKQRGRRTCAGRAARARRKDPRRPRHTGRARDDGVPVHGHRVASGPLRNGHRYRSMQSIWRNMYTDDTNSSNMFPTQYVCVILILLLLSSLSLLSLLY